MWYFTVHWFFCIILEPLWHRNLRRLRDSGDNQAEWGGIGSGPSVFSLLCHAPWMTPESSLNTVPTQAVGQILTNSWGKGARLLSGLMRRLFRRFGSSFACAVSTTCVFLRYWDKRTPTFPDRDQATLRQSSKGHRCLRRSPSAWVKRSCVGTFIPFSV